CGWSVITVPLRGSERSEGASELLCRSPPCQPRVAQADRIGTGSASTADKVSKQNGLPQVVISPAFHFFGDVTGELVVILLFKVNRAAGTELGPYRGAMLTQRRRHLVTREPHHGMSVDMGFDLLKEH